LAESEAIFCEKVCATVDGVLAVEAPCGGGNGFMLAATGGCAKGAEKFSRDAAPSIISGERRIHSPTDKLYV
jgi:hypothetical protein